MWLLNERFIDIDIECCWFVRSRRFFFVGVVYTVVGNTTHDGHVVNDFAIFRKRL